KPPLFLYFLQNRSIRNGSMCGRRVLLMYGITPAPAHIHILWLQHHPLGIVPLFTDVPGMPGSPFAALVPALAGGDSRREHDAPAPTRNDSPAGHRGCARRASAGVAGICIKLSCLTHNHGFRPRARPPYNTRILQSTGDSFGAFFFVCRAT